jgi:hypothetical protein
MYDPRFGTRGTGEGAYADSIASLFQATARRHGLLAEEGATTASKEPTTFERPAVARVAKRKGQLPLF